VTRIKAVSDCSLCLLKLALTSADAAGAPEELRLAAVRAALAALAEDDFSRQPPAIARAVLDRVYPALGNPDPFARIKSDHNRKALELSDRWAPDYLAAAADADDRLERALRTALVGNGMDPATLPDNSDPASFESWLKVPWSIFDFAAFKDGIAPGRSLLYLCDNAGEIAFDRFLIRELLERGLKVTVSVKDGPALNDATLEDALEVGLDWVEGGGGRARLISTGQATMGVDLPDAAPEWLEAFHGADLVLAKGQANLESLHDSGREVFFLTLVKCTHVARYYDLKKGSALFLRSGRE